MVTCGLELELRLHESRSLKEKRKVLRSVIDRLRARFRASVAEVAHQDEWRACGIGVAIVARDRLGCEQQVEAITRFLDADGRFDVVGLEANYF